MNARDAFGIDAPQIQKCISSLKIRGFRTFVAWFKIPLQRLRSETRRSRTSLILYLRDLSREAMSHVRHFFIAGVTALLTDHFAHYFEAEQPLRWLDSLRLGRRNGKTGGSDACLPT